MGKMRKRKRNIRFAYILPRISSLILVFLLFVFIYKNMLNIFSQNPDLANLILGVSILIITLSCWSKSGKLNGAMLLLFSLAYFFIMWQRILWINVAISSIWLFLTGILYFLESPGISTKR